MFKRIGLLLSAVVILLIATALIISTGLPDRIALTGQVAGDSNRIIAPEKDALAPDFEAPTLTDEVINLESLRGDPVIINFWATWCGPCRREMPDLQAVYEKYADQGLRLLAVNLSEPISLISKWTEEMGLTFDIVLDDGNIEAMYRVRVQPMTFVISPDGVITEVFYGQTSASALERAILPLFTES